MTKRQRYDLYLNTSELGTMHIAEAVLVEEGGVLLKMGFRYTRSFLSHSHCFSLDPVQLPLGVKEYVLDCRQGSPGILDDYLPDDWGRKVLAQLVFYRDGKKLSHHSCIEMLSVLGPSRIGALQWVEQGDNANYGIGCDIGNIKGAELAAQTVDEPTLYSEQIDEMSLLYLANAGTGVGGARPKALVYDNDVPYLAKFNRISQDRYNNARVELACLKMAELAGLAVYTGKVIEGINGREVLLLNRFDIDKQTQGGYRKHLLTANALLKEPGSQRDRGGVFRYDDLVDLVRKYSCNVEEDLENLLRMMLFNVGINNTDTHERNFSFIHQSEGYQLAPAYDMVPSLTVGQYPVAGFGYSASPPSCSEILSKGKVFGLSKTRVKTISEQVQCALQQWFGIARDVGVIERDIENIAQVMQL